MTRRPAIRLLALLAAAAAVTAGRAYAQPLTPTEIPLAEVLEVLLLDRELVAIDAGRGGQLSERLQIGESVLWYGARGKVGLALTTRRVLSAATGSASWQELAYDQNEQPPAAGELGDRVALVLTSQRAIGMNGTGGNLVEYRFGPREQVIASRVGNNVAVVVTTRAALGLSPLTGGFFRAKIGAGERVEAITTAANLATLTTDRRVLIFRTPTGTWEERSRDLR
jgi:hypothetical protein